MRVLFAALAKLDFENYLVLNQAQLARELGMKQGNVSRAVARLLEEGVLLAGPRIGVNRTYTLNPHYGWKGSARGHQEALQARMKAAGLSVVQTEPTEPVDDRTGDLFEPSR
jgi:DNA-binding Lrp family transcriptional regulator